MNHKNFLMIVYIYVGKINLLYFSSFIGLYKIVTYRPFYLRLNLQHNIWCVSEYPPWKQYKSNKIIRKGKDLRVYLLCRFWDFFILNVKNQIGIL